MFYIYSIKMTFELRISRGGKLGRKMEDNIREGNSPEASYTERHGDNPIVKSGEYDNRDVFRLPEA